MSNLFQKALQLITGDTADQAGFQIPKNRPLKKLTERQLLQLESEIGSRLFGAVPVGHRREFFCLDEKTWIWHEEWNEPKLGRRSMTVRYEVHENGVLKVLEGPRYSYLEGEELANLLTAVTAYYEQIAREVYERDPRTGYKLA